MDPVTFGLMIQLGTAAIKGGGQLWEWWTKVHEAAKQDLPLTDEQSEALDALIESRKNDPNWQPDAT